MPYYFFIWTEDNVKHLAENGVTQNDFEAIVCEPLSVGVSRSSGCPIAFGVTEDGRNLACVYKELDDDEFLPITAYEVE